MKNVGDIDKIIRIIVGLALISVVFVGLKTAWGWVGLVLLLTGFFNFCPLHSIIGLNTCKKCKE